MTSHTMGLLDILAAKTGCIYLSDLKLPKTKIHLLRPLRKTDAAAFSLDEWKDAVEYLTGHPYAATTQQQAKQYLIDYILQMDLHII